MDDYRFTDPKTKVSVRKNYLDSTTLDVLAKWRERQSDLLTTDFALSYNAVSLNNHAVGNAITRYAKMAKLPRIRSHALRHSHASLLISMGENPLIIKDRFEHEDIQTTLGTYEHLYPNNKYEDLKCEAVLQQPRILYFIFINYLVINE